MKKATELNCDELYNLCKEGKLKFGDDIYLSHFEENGESFYKLIATHPIDEVFEQWVKNFEGLKTNINSFFDIDYQSFVNEINTCEKYIFFFFGQTKNDVLELFIITSWEESLSNLDFNNSSCYQAYSIDSSQKIAPYKMNQTNYEELRDAYKDNLGKDISNKIKTKRITESVRYDLGEFQNYLADNINKTLRMQIVVPSKVNIQTKDPVILNYLAKERNTNRISLAFFTYSPLASSPTTLTNPSKPTDIALTQP